MQSQNTTPFLFVCLLLLFCAIIKQVANLEIGSSAVAQRIAEDTPRRVNLLVAWLGTAMVSYALCNLARSLAVLARRYSRRHFSFFDKR